MAKRPSTSPQGRTRGGHDWTHRFPVIAAAVAALPLHSAVLDGEAVVLDAAGRSDFAALQAALGTSGRGPGRRRADEAKLYAFDLLFLDGVDLRPWSLDNRRDALLSVVGEHGDPLLFSQAFDQTGTELFAAAAANGLEGIVSKRRDRPYMSGRSDMWLKTKCVQDATFVVIGYQPTPGRGSLGAVHVAAEEPTGLRYVGAVGSGFSVKAAAALQTRLDALARPSPRRDGPQDQGCALGETRGPCRRPLSGNVTRRSAAACELQGRAGIGGAREQGAGMGIGCAGHGERRAAGTFRARWRADTADHAAEVTPARPGRGPRISRVLPPPKNGCAA